MNAYMTCPKCNGQMQQFTRSGLTVEQCTNCRGVFLDYGELEHLVRAESAYNQQMYQAAPPPPMPGAPPPPAQQAGAGAIAGAVAGALMGQGHHGHHSHHKHKRRKSFLEELFDD